MIHTHDAWPSQMQSNLLISSAKTLAIDRVLLCQSINVRVLVRTTRDRSI